MIKIYFLHTGNNIPFYVGETSKPLKKRLNDHKKKYGSHIEIELIEEVEEAIGFKVPGDNRDNMSPYDQGVKDAILAVLKLHPDLDVKAVVDIIQGDEDPINEGK